MKTTQAGLARICGVSRSAIWYRVQKGHLRPDENGLLDVSRSRRALKRRGSRIFIPYNERELLEIEKLKLQTYKLRKQIDEIDGNLVPIKKMEELLSGRRSDVFEIFREHMIEQLYLDLAEETNDKIIYSILIKACQSAVKDLFRFIILVQEGNLPVFLLQNCHCNYSKNKNIFPTFFNNKKAIISMNSPPCYNH